MQLQESREEPPKGTKQLIGHCTSIELHGWSEEESGGQGWGEAGEESGSE